METFGLIAFFGMMLLLAAIPSGSVGFVVVSSATRGLPCGIAAALGIVGGDLIFVTLALLGMTALAESMGALFAILRYIGGGYLIWLGIGLLRSAKNSQPPVATHAGFRNFGTFNVALLLTLGDIKARERPHSPVLSHGSEPVWFGPLDKLWRVRLRTPRLI